MPAAPAHFDAVILGAGAAGLFCAGIAGQRGLKVLVIDHAEKLAEKHHTQLLGQMPLHISLREDLDKGTPTVISRPESEFTAIYRQLADRVAAQLYWQGEVIPGEISFRAV